MGLLNPGPKMRGVKFSQSGRRDAGKQNALSLLSLLLRRLSRRKGKRWRNLERKRISSARALTLSKGPTEKLRQRGALTRIRRKASKRVDFGGCVTPQSPRKVHKLKDLSRAVAMNAGAVARGAGDTAEISHARGSNFPRSQLLNGRTRGRRF